MKNIGCSCERRDCKNQPCTGTLGPSQTHIQCHKLEVLLRSGRYFLTKGVNGHQPEKLQQQNECFVKIYTKKVLKLKSYSKKYKHILDKILNLISHMFQNKILIYNPKIVKILPPGQF